MNIDIELNKMLKDFEEGRLKLNKEKVIKENIIFYGAGDVGKKMYAFSSKVGIKVTCFLDKNININKLNYEIPVYHPEDKDVNRYKTNHYVILTGHFPKSIYNEIKEYLKKIGFNNIYGLHEVDLSSLDIERQFYKKLFGNVFGYKEHDKNNIIDAFNLFEEKRDRELYFNYIKAHLTNNLTNFSEPDDIELQYMDKELSDQLNYNNFIDCGGFDGDTVVNLLNNRKKINKLAIFEPQSELCKKIHVSLKHFFNEMIIFPCGVSSKFEQLKFDISKENPTSSKINDCGNEIIQCVSIDEALLGFEPTFIKMDIEGYEFEALKGAKSTIIDNLPCLAICVYHSLEDIWRIPLLIRSYYSGYKFYLRSYNYLGFETVLYAIPQKEFNRC